MNVQEIRRARFAQLIRDKYAGSQAMFIEQTGENQGEVSALLSGKSFGEKKARKIEAESGLPIGWLDVDPQHERDQDVLIAAAISKQLQRISSQKLRALAVMLDITV